MMLDDIKGLREQYQIQKDKLNRELQFGSDYGPHIEEICRQIDRYSGAIDALDRLSGYYVFNPDNSDNINKNDNNENKVYI